MHSRISLRWVFKILMLAMLFSLSLARPVEANPLRNDAAQLFYLKLAPYGTWVRHRIYGRAWFPRNMPEDWRPYQDGYWAYTHDYGWLWVSDWAWGWATDHYGRWVWDDWYGWIWVPGAVWSPAWVVWRYGDGYVSWAPMPIQYVWNPYVGYTNEYFDFDRYIFWDCWVTTHEHDFPRRNQPRKFLPPQMNREILPRTRYADPLVVRDKRIVNRGIPWQRIEQVTGSPFKPVVPTVVLDPDDHKASGRRPKSREDVLIYRPIDNQPTVETIRDEAESDKALAEKINLNRQLLSDRNRVAEESPGHRRPGRLIGRPKPLDDQGPENPLTMPQEMQQTAPAFLTLPAIQDATPSPGREAPLTQFDQRDTGSGRLRRHGVEDVNDQPAPIEYMQQNMPQEPEREAFGRPRPDLEQQQQQQQQQQAEQERMRQEAIRQHDESARQQQIETERQQRQLEQQQQAEQKRMQQETIRQQQESVRQQQVETERQQRQLEQQQQAEQERTQQKAIRQQQESAHQQQLEAERQQRQLEQQQQAEQERMQQETIRQQQESVRQQQVETERQQRQLEQQQQAEQERMQQETTRQQQESVRQQQLEAERQQQQLERQQVEQERMRQEAILEQQQQAIQQQQMQMRQQETIEQATPRGDGRGRGGRGFGRGRD